MERREREALALDIAKRVRLMCVQTAPKWFLDLIRDGTRNTMPIYGMTSSYSSCLVEVEKRSGALFINLIHNNAIVVRVRLDEDDQAQPPEFV